jgi:DNA invertase Pin-like site-specific DNA recombinase
MDTEDILVRLENKVDRIERDLGELAPLIKRVDDHEMRLRAVEMATVKLTTQAALIAALVGAAVPILLKVFGV